MSTLSLVIYSPVDYRYIYRVNVKALQQDLFECRKSCKEIEQLQLLNPIRIYTSQANCMVVLFKNSTQEKGLIITPIESSYIPVTKGNVTVTKSEQGIWLYTYQMSY
ncbi:hypothetical protein [Aliivibrio kagoshimensis]|uniref:hypothetical protein n=1 Tax=Aliivibrio kagoshimensis TaxID=2910230 RepID=UPI003D0EDC49